MTKYDFPTSTAICVNDLTPNDVSVVLNITYKCKNNFNVTPCINVVNYSVNVVKKNLYFLRFLFLKLRKLLKKVEYQVILM